MTGQFQLQWAVLSIIAALNVAETVILSTEGRVTSYTGKLLSVMMTNYLLDSASSSDESESDFRFSELSSTPALSLWA